MKEWLEYATGRERQRVDTLLMHKAKANAELQKIRDRCWKRMKRERENNEENTSENDGKA